MNHSSILETNRTFASSEEILLLWNPKFHYRFQRKKPLDDIMNTAYILIPYVFNIMFNITLHLHLDLSSDLLTSGFPNRMLYAFLIFPMCATYPAHLMHTYLFNAILLYKK